MSPEFLVALDGAVDGHGVVFSIGIALRESVKLSAAPAGNAVGGPTVQILDRADQVDALAEAVAAHGSSRAPEEAEAEAEPGPGANRPFAPPRAERSRRDA